LRTLEESFHICGNGRGQILPSYQSISALIYNKLVTSPQLSKAKQAEEKRLLISRAKSRVIRQKSLGLRSLEDSLKKPHHASNQWQILLHAEFSKILNKIFHDSGLPTKSSMSKQMFDENHEKTFEVFFYNCETLKLLFYTFTFSTKDKSLREEKRVSENVTLFKCSATTGHLKGKKVINILKTCLKGRFF